MAVCYLFGTYRRVNFNLLDSSYRCARCNEKGNKFPSAQLVRVISLIWQHASKPQGHLQASSVKYRKVLIIPARRKRQRRDYN